MNTPVILLLEDNQTDAGLVKQMLRRTGVAAELIVTESREQYLQALACPRLDMVISDSSIPGLGSLDAMRLVNACHPDAAFILLTGSMTTRQAEHFKDAGAAACLTKDQMGKLGPIVHELLESKQPPPILGIEAENERLCKANLAAMRLVRAIKDLSTARDMASIQEIVRRAARDLNGADGATFVLRDDDKCYYADEDAIAPLWKGQRFPMQTCISGWAMLNRKHAVVEDISKDPRIPLDAYLPTFVRSLVMVPIRAEAPIGAIGNYWSETRTPTDEEIALIQALADSTSIAIENVQSYQELERRVERRTAELKDMNQALEEFSYFVSHDLRVPLRHIHAFSDIVREDFGGQLGDEARNALDHIQSAALNMGDLLEGLLGLAHSGHHLLHPVEIDMNSMVTTALDLLRRTADPATEFKIAALPRAIGDQLLVRQVWINLIGNAVKYSSASTPPRIEIGGFKQGEEDCYFVRDNGVGFDQADAAQMFGAFRRLESGRKFSGSGIGLAIVKRIISRHGGRIWTESQLGQGATFYFSLPRLGAIN